ncbi:SGNH/GDSL hydrolase family protein [Bradyrhizobium sp. C9]|uniref:SGNH/GDSL hydrolase family protein n=1 Tax=Bradyrhizobium sp. C9 TaxID=142585 RepID=UPI000BEACD62|nr:SGNH/GDSL hydrolase family protein [Bradyrhizobium sp. C9]PDT77168.1 hypothetical protein CO675_11555 [Bradyrhizobium sp. C9]
MTALASYSTGTVSVAANGTTVTGAATIWSSTNVRPGDVLQIGNFHTIITDVTDPTHLVITPWGGGAQANVAYVIWQISLQRIVGAQAMSDVSTLVAALNTDGFYIFVASSLTAPDPSYGKDGQYGFQASTGKLWVKTEGAWSFLGIYKGFAFRGNYDSGVNYSVNDVVSSGGSAYIYGYGTPTAGNAPPNPAYWTLLAGKGDKGDKGDRGSGYGGTSDWSLTIGLGNHDFQTQAGLAYTNGARIRLTADPANWMEGIGYYVSATGAMTVVVDKIAGAGTFEFWNINVAGEPGVGYGGTSTTSLTIGTGNQNFSTQAELAYKNGARARITADSGDYSNWMEGVAYYNPVSGAMTVVADKFSGAGTFASWNINVAGQPGAGDVSSVNYASEYAANTPLVRVNIGAQTDCNKDFSHLLRYHGKNIVVTGDSLSFNAYDFPIPGGSPVNAYDFYPGMMSWSFMLRDFAHRLDPAWEHADNLDWILDVDAGTPAPAYSQAAYVTPFNSRYVGINATKSTDRAWFMHRFNSVDSSGKAFLHWLNNPNAGSNNQRCQLSYSLYPYTTEVDVALLTNQATTSWAGFQTHQTEIDCGANNQHPVKIILKNFSNADGSALTGNMTMFIQGISSKLTNFQLTGHGGYTTAQINAEYAARIGNYNPDLLIIITGANDRASKTKEQFAADLTSLINNTRATNPHCEIVVMAPTPNSAAGYGPTDVLNGSTMRDFLALERVTAESLNCLFFDTQALFATLDPAYWRYDNIHMTKRGNKVLFDALVQRHFSGGREQRLDPRYYDPMYTSVATTQAVNFNDKRREVIHGSCALTYSQSTGLFTISDLKDNFDALDSVATTSFPYEVVCKFRYRVKSLFDNPGVIRASFDHSGSSGQWFQARVSTVGDNSITFYLWNMVGGSIATAAQMDGATFSLRW